MNHYSLLLALMPLAGAVAVRCLPTRLASSIARSVVFAGCAASVPLWFWYRPTNPELQLVDRVGIPLLGIHYSLGFDGIGLSFVFLAGIVCLVATWLPAPDRSDRQRSHFGWLLAHYGALLGAFLAADALSFGVACAVALVTLWQLIGRAERRPLALRALRDISPAALLLMTAGSIKVGVYGMLRFGLPLVPNLAPLVIHRAPGLALALAVVAAAGAGWQSQWVRMIAYLSMSQAATALAGFLTLTPAGISSGVQFSIVHALLTTAGLTAVYVGGRWHDGDALLSERRVALSPVRAVLLFAGALAAGLPALRSWSGVPPSVWWNGMAFVGMLVSLGIVTVSGDRALREALVDTPTAVSTPRVSIAPAMGVVLLLAAAAWTGTSPNTLTRTLRVPSLKLAAQVDARYRSEFVAACDTTVTPELRAASPAAQFLAAAPCGPDGKPLEGSVVVPLTPAAGAR